MGAILSPRFLDVAKRAGYQPDELAEVVQRREEVKRDNDGRASVKLAGLFILADYKASGPNAADIAIENLVISGQEVGPEWFDAETLVVWQRSIAADRAQDLRIAREAAAFEAWERGQ